MAAKHRADESGRIPTTRLTNCVMGKISKTLNPVVALLRFRTSVQWLATVGGDARPGRRQPDLVQLTKVVG